MPVYDSYNPNKYVNYVLVLMKSSTLKNANIFGGAVEHRSQ
jgi:hypothetical protein